MGEYRFDWHAAGRDTFQQWLIPTILADLPGDQSLFDQLSELTDNWCDVNVTVQINGIEVDPTGFFTSIESNLTYLTEREAERLVRENEDMTQIHTSIRQFERAVRREMNMALGRLGIEPSEEDRY